LRAPGTPYFNVQPLDTTMLLRAYGCGVFPMADDRAADRVFWVEPKKRGVLPLDGFHLSRSLAKTILKADRFQRHRQQPISTASSPPAPRKRRAGPAPGSMRRSSAACRELHTPRPRPFDRDWHDGKLVGGLYGITLAGAFFGESMFTRVRDASKIALAHLVARLRVGGFTLLDCQFQTDHLARWARSSSARRLCGVARRRAFDGLGRRAIPDFPRSTDSPAPRFAGGHRLGIRPISGKRIVQLLAQTS
jgi:leucyl/phenylalanyl-tRNA--protein transferase